MAIWATWASHLIYVRGLGVYVFGLTFAASFISGSLLDTMLQGRRYGRVLSGHLRSRLRNTLTQEMRDLRKAKSRQRSGSTHMSPGCQISADICFVDV